MKLLIINTPRCYRIKVYDSTGQLLAECGYRGTEFSNPENGETYQVMTPYHGDRYKNVELARLSIVDLSEYERQEEES